MPDALHLGEEIGIARKINAVAPLHYKADTGKSPAKKYTRAAVIRAGHLDGHTVDRHNIPRHNLYHTSEAPPAQRPGGSAWRDQECIGGKHTQGWNVQVVVVKVGDQHSINPAPVRHRSGLVTTERPDAVAQDRVCKQSYSVHFDKDGGMAGVSQLRQRFQSACTRILLKHQHGERLTLPKGL